MAKSVGRVHYASLADIHTLDGTSLVNKKKLLNRMEQFDAILVLGERIYFQNGMSRNSV